MLQYTWSQIFGYRLATEQQWIDNQSTTHYEGQYCNMKVEEVKEAGGKVSAENLRESKNISSAKHQFINTGELLNKTSLLQSG